MDVPPDMMRIDHYRLMQFDDTPSCPQPPPPSAGTASRPWLPLEDPPHNLSDRISRGELPRAEVHVGLHQLGFVRDGLMGRWVTAVAGRVGAVLQALQARDKGALLFLAP